MNFICTVRTRSCIWIENPLQIYDISKFHSKMWIAIELGLLIWALINDVTNCSNSWKGDLYHCGEVRNFSANIKRKFCISFDKFHSKCILCRLTHIYSDIWRAKPPAQSLWYFYPCQKKAHCLLPLELVLVLLLSLLFNAVVVSIFFPRKLPFSHFIFDCLFYLFVVFEHAYEMKRIFVLFSLIFLCYSLF